MFKTLITQRSHLKVVDLPITQEHEPGSPPALMDEMDDLIFGIAEDQREIRDTRQALDALENNMRSKQDRLATIINTLEIGIKAERVK